MELKNLIDSYPINTFKGETKKEIIVLIEKAYEVGQKKIVFETTVDTQGFIERAKKDLITQLINELPEEKKKREPAKTLSEIASAGYINGYNQYRQEVIKLLESKL